MLQSIRRAFRPARTDESPSDLEVLDSGLVFIPSQDQLDYLWLRVRQGGEIGYRVVRLVQLAFIPLDARADAGVLQKMRTVLRSLYGAEVEFLYLAAGIFEPLVGIIQCYGVAAFDPDLETACNRTARSMAALRSALGAAYRQVAFKPLDTRTAGWIFAAFAEMEHTLVAIG